MKKCILAIETSCDETSAAVLVDDRTLLSNIVSSQINVHSHYGGVMPEIASRLHAEQITLVLERALRESNLDYSKLSAVAVTAGPGLIGALHVGLQAAKAIAIAYQIPLIAVHHIAGHIYANHFLGTMDYPSLAVVVSGGHTELVYMPHELEFQIIGRTQDDAIGEAYDKVARVLGLPYPGGPEIDRLARQGVPSYILPAPKTDHPLNVSYSGLKTAVVNLVHNAEQRGEALRVADVCASFQKRAVDMIVDRLLIALHQYPVQQIVVAGGVAANSYLRESLPRRVREGAPHIEVSIPPFWCCTDNAAMIAVLASRMYDLGHFAPLDQGADPDWSIEDFLPNPKE